MCMVGNTLGSGACNTTGEIFQACKQFGGFFYTEMLASLFANLNSKNDSTKALLPTITNGGWHHFNHSSNLYFTIHVRTYTLVSFLQSNHHATPSNPHDNTLFLYMFTSLTLCLSSGIIPSGFESAVVI